MYCDYARRMRHLPRPRSTIFRIVLAMALLAWTALALGAPRTPVPMGAAHAQMNAVDLSVHCMGMSQAHVTSSRLHPAPAVPGGQGDCCHGGCHCLSSCSVALLVPFAGAGTIPKAGRERAQVTAIVLTAGAAPPLRPPIA